MTTRKPAHKPSVYEVWERRNGELPRCQYRGLDTREAGHQLIESCQWIDEAMLLVDGKPLARSIDCTLTVAECQ